jgi:hypothetical protein
MVPVGAKDMSAEQASTRKENMNDDNKKKTETDEPRTDAAAQELPKVKPWGTFTWGETATEPAAAEVAK